MAITRILAECIGHLLDSASAGYASAFRLATSHSSIVSIRKFITPARAAPAEIAPAITRLISNGASGPGGRGPFASDKRMVPGDDMDQSDQWPTSGRSS